MEKIISIYDKTFFRFLLLMSRKKNDYNYGMTLVIFTYSIALFILPLIALITNLLNVRSKTFFWTEVGSFILIWISNYLMTKERHKLIYEQYFNEMGAMKKYSILLMTLIGMIFFICFTSIVLRN